MDTGSTERNDRSPTDAAPVVGNGERPRMAESQAPAGGRPSEPTRPDEKKKKKKKRKVIGKRTVFRRKTRTARQTREYAETLIVLRNLIDPFAKRTEPVNEVETVLMATHFIGALASMVKEKNERSAM